MGSNPELAQLLETVIDGLAVIHGWAEFALLNPQAPQVQEQALKMIKFTACQLAHRLREYPGGHDAGSEPGT